MGLDPLASRLELLVSEGSIAASELSRAMRVRLGVPFALGLLEDVKAGGGKRTMVRNAQALMSWIEREYPSGLHGIRAPLPPRARAVANFRDSKAGGPLGRRPQFMRGFDDIVLEREGGTLPLGALTAAHELAAVLVRADDPWRVQGRLALVENFELFMHVEQIDPTLDAAVWTRGRAKQAVLNWIASMPACHVVHFGDYDPVGLAEYLRVLKLLPVERAELFVPHDLELRIRDYGNAKLLSDSLSILGIVRAEATPDVQIVLDVMDRYGLGLEQESLLIGLSVLMIP